MKFKEDTEKFTFYHAIWRGYENLLKPLQYGAIRMKLRNYSAYQKQLIDIDFYVIGTSDY